MTRLFMPSCNNSITYARSIKRLGNYLLKRGLVNGITGCCKPSSSTYKEIPPDADLVVICNSCLAIAEEGLKISSVKNALELIREDESFPYPDYGGEEITIQDCWRACGRHGLQDAVRELMIKMNLKPVELKENHDNCRFCGTSTLMEVPAENVLLAPEKLGRYEEGMFVHQEPEERRRIMCEHVSKINTPRVASYCFGCDKGLVLGGADSASLVNLLFDNI